MVRRETGRLWLEQWIGNPEARGLNPCLITNFQNAYGFHSDNLY